MTIKKNCTYYLSDGTEVFVVSLSPLVVCEVVEVCWGDECDTRDGRMFSTSSDNLYESPPLSKKNAELKAIEDKIKERKAELRKLNSAIAKDKTERERKLREFANVDQALENIERAKYETRGR